MNGMAAVQGEDSVELLFERLDDYMNKKGLRSSAQRRTIARVFFTGPNHVSIEELLAQARREDPRIGYATVYRTLKLFTECGIAEERNFGDGPSRYELSDESNEHHHDHMICVECGVISEFHNAEIERIQAGIAATHGFRVDSHKHEIYGACAACQRGSKNRRAN